MYILANDCLNGLIKLLNFWINMYISRKKNMRKELISFYVFHFKLAMENKALLYSDFFCNLICVH
jgi:hypothetical protein